MKTPSVRLEWGRRGGDRVTKGFTTHTEEFEPYVESSGSVFIVTLTNGLQSLWLT